MAVTPKGRALGMALRNARKRQGLTLRDLAAKIDKQSGEISRWENGERPCHPERVAQILTALGVTGTPYQEIVSLSYESKNQAWVATTLPEREQQMSAFIDFEQNASTITEVAPLLVPGLLQEPSYIRAMMTAGRVPSSDIATRVAVRMGRRDVINRRDPVTFSAFIGETVLHQMVGSPKVMVNQLAHLLEMHERLNVQLRVVPYRNGWNPGLDGSFIIMESKCSTPIIQLANRRSSLFLHRPEDVASYRGALDELLPLSFSPGDTNRVIRKCLERWEKLP